MYYLYVKTHNKTGLKYLGYTKNDPNEYKGSGKHWIRHIKTHGDDISTELLLETDNKEEIKETGLYYSNLWNIVESKEWANLIPESAEGIDSKTASDLAKRRIQDGTHHWLDSEEKSKNNKIRIENGSHPFLGKDMNERMLKEGRHSSQRDDVRKKMIESQRKRIEDGTHHFLNSDVQRNTQFELSAKGKHNFSSGEIQRKTHKKRIDNGTHHFLGGEIQRKTYSKLNYIREEIKEIALSKNIKLPRRWNLGSKEKLLSLLEDIKNREQD